MTAISLFLVLIAWRPDQEALAVTDEEFASLTATVSALQSEVARLRSELDAVKSSSVMALAPYLGLVQGEISGLRGPHVIFTGINLHIRSGSGYTDDYVSKGGTLTGLGNLVLGYNELPFTTLLTGDRGGSHNLIIGPLHRYSSYGGFVGGRANTISGPSASVSGGYSNTASGVYSSVSGGGNNKSSGYSSSVSGGIVNTASGYNSSVSGGVGNTASWYYSSVSGGVGNTASGYSSSVSGGRKNTASWDSSSVSGGYSNTASGYYSSVSGGYTRAATGISDWVAGGLLQDQ